MQVYAEQTGWALLWLLQLLMVFVALAIMCDAHLVPAIEVICKRWHIPDEIAGASLLAFGSSAPEVMINSVATAKPHPQIEMSLPAIFGSAMIAFGLIPALCSFVVKGELELNAYPIARDSLCYAVTLVVLVRILSDGGVGVWESGLLTGAFFLYMFILAAPLLYARCRKGKGDVPLPAALTLPPPGGVNKAPAVGPEYGAAVEREVSLQGMRKRRMSSRNMARCLRESVTRQDGPSDAAVYGPSGGERSVRERSVRSLTASRTRSRGQSTVRLAVPPAGYGATGESRAPPAAAADGATGGLLQVQQIEVDDEGGNDDDDGKEAPDCIDRFSSCFFGSFEKFCEAIMLKCWFTVEPDRVKVPIPTQRGVTAEDAKRALGVMIDAEDDVLTVTAVAPGGAAAEAGVKPGWVLERIAEGGDDDGDDDDDDGGGGDDDGLEDEDGLAEAWAAAPEGHVVVFNDPPACAVVAFVFLMALIYVSVLSTLCLTLTQYLADTICMPQTLAGATLLALGAQVPDTMGSVAMARAGLADGAVSNAIGSQLINVSLGVGLPFLVYDLLHNNAAIRVGQSGITSLLGMGACLATLIVVYLCACLWKYLTCAPAWRVVELPSADFRELKWESPPPTGPDGHSKVARITGPDVLPDAVAAAGLNIGISIAEWRCDGGGIWAPVDPANPVKCVAGISHIQLKIMRKGGLSGAVSGKVLLVTFVLAFGAFVWVDVWSRTTGSHEALPCKFG